jgi:hypothetical protein
VLLSECWSCVGQHDTTMMIVTLGHLGSASLLSDKCLPVLHCTQKAAVRYAFASQRRREKTTGPGRLATVSFTLATGARPRQAVMLVHQPEWGRRRDRPPWSPS